MDSLPRSEAAHSLSRRSFVLLLAAATCAGVLGAPTSAQTQTNLWREYRRDDLGFRVELPGEPKIETEEKKDAHEPWIRTVSAEVDSGGLLLGISYQEYRAALDPEEQFRLQREGFRLMGQAPSRETALQLRYPGREFVVESEHLNLVLRLFVVENRTLTLQAIGGRTIHNDPAVRRFLDSLALLPRAN